MSMSEGSIRLSGLETKLAGKQDLDGFYICRGGKVHIFKRC